MRLNFSSTNYLNTDISGERGNVYYTISTSNKVTTITKYRGSDASPSSTVDSGETVGTIEWYRLKSTVMKFDGKALNVDDVMQKRSWETGRYFVGPDRKTYKWKIESTHCWMKAAGTTAELVRVYQKNMGIRKLSHPAYLEVSPKVVPILDHVILTFVYVEWLRQERSRRQGEARAMAASNAAAMSAAQAAAANMAAMNAQVVAANIAAMNAQAVAANIAMMDAAVAAGNAAAMSAAAAPATPTC